MRGGPGMPCSQIHSIFTGQAMHLYAGTSGIGWCDARLPVTQLGSPQNVTPLLA